MRDLKRYVDECVMELSDYGIDASKVAKRLNWRVSRAKQRYGECRFKNSIPYEINISRFMLDESVLKNDLYLKNTIIHELLHALAPKAGHKGEWKRLARQVNLGSNGKYNIQRCNSLSEMGIKETAIAKPKYTLKCKECGNEYYHMRRCRSVNHPELWRCGKCKGHLELIVS